MLSAGLDSIKRIHRDQVQASTWRKRLPGSLKVSSWEDVINHLIDNQLID